MTSREFTKHFHRRPFNPFALRLNDGMHYDVPAPDFVAHAPGSRHVFILDVRGGGHAIIDLERVNRITFADPPLDDDTGAEDAV